MPAGEVSVASEASAASAARAFEFSLPFGLVDAEGDVHRNGVMRLATARDEIAPLADARVRHNPAYLALVLLARVVTRLGTLEVSAELLESLPATDLAWLQTLYRRVNTPPDEARRSCQACGAPVSL